MMNKLNKTITKTSTIFLIISAFIVLFLGWLNPGESGIIFFVIIYCCALIPLSLFSAGWLIHVKRKSFSKTLIWIVFQIVFAVAMFLYPSRFVGLFFASLLFVLIPLLSFVDFLYAYYNEYSLQFIGWGSVGFIWSILLVWRITGNLFDQWIASMASASNNLWLLYSLMFETSMMIMTGILCFIIESVRAIAREYANN